MSFQLIFCSSIEPTDWTPGSDINVVPPMQVSEYTLGQARMVAFTLKVEQKKSGKHA